MAVTLNGTTGLVFNDNTTQATSPFAGGLGFRNRIINGDMRIDQRNNGTSVTPTGSAFITDRFNLVISQGSKITAGRNLNSVTPPTGFTNYLGAQTASAYSVLASDNFIYQHGIEGFNAADLAWGTANAAAITLSFWVRSSLTGTFGGALYNSALNRSYPFTYSISTANTWEQKSITIAGDTSGTWLTDNGAGIYLSISLGCGSTMSGTAGAWAGGFFRSATGATSLVSTNGATFYITGVQLEKGSTATSFDYRPYGTELALCQRYLPVWSANSGSSGTMGTGQAYSTTQGIVFLPHAVTPRVPVSGISLSGGAYFTASAAGALNLTSLVFNTASFNGVELAGTVSSGLTAGNATLLRAQAGNAVTILGNGCEL